MRFTRMIIATVAIALGLGVAVLVGVVRAQGTKATISDPAGPPPDPTHIPVVLPKDIKWTGQEGRQQQAVLFGDPNKPGLYGVIIKWYPGNFSQPHFHDQERYAYVISGTWWVSTSNVYDEKTTYPVRAGTVAIDKVNTVHWDGARTGEKEPAVLELVGMGPVKTIQVDENGKPKAAPPAR
jgi:quercetin dioxygenase-like cupin family protein